MNSIDGINLANYGIFILKGGDDTFLRFPERKAPPQNTWFEEDGLDVELSTVLFKPLETQLQLYLMADNITAFKSRLNALETLLYATGTRSVYIGDLDKTFTCRFVGLSSYKHTGGLYKSGAKSAHITTDFVLDNPTQIYTPNQLTLTGGLTPTHIQLNDVDLGDFGIIVNGLYDTALKSGQPKSGFVNEYAHLSGAIADTAFSPKRESKELLLSGTMIAASRAALWQNWTALFNYMRQESALVIDFADGTSLSCYYQAMTEIKKKRPLSIDARVGFTLKLKTILKFRKTTSL